VHSGWATTLASGCSASDPADALPGELNVDVTGTAPHVHFAAGLLLHPVPEVLVGDEEDVAVRRRFLDDADGVATGADDIAERLHSGAAIDVSDHVIIPIRVVLQELLKAICRTTLFKRTSGIFVWKDDRFAWIDDLGRFRHEMDAAEGDHGGIGVPSFVGEPERIAHIVGHILDLLDLVVVGENDRVAPFF